MKQVLHRKLKKMTIDIRRNHLTTGKIIICRLIKASNLIMLQESATIVLGRNIKFFLSVSMVISSNWKFIF